VTNCTLYIVVCGAPLAARAGDGARAARANGMPIRIHSQRSAQASALVLRQSPDHSPSMIWQVIRPGWRHSLLRYAGIVIVDPHDGATTSIEPNASGAGGAVAGGFRWNGFPVSFLNDQGFGIDANRKGGCAS
jgi:hypothetical protein